MQTFTSKLINKKQLTPHVSLLQFSTQNAPDFTFQAGQYVIIHVPQDDGSTARRLYSIASSPSQKETIELVIEIVPDGVGSQYVEQLSNGDEVTLQGPAGLFNIRRDVACNVPTKIVFLATGTGIAPIRSMIHELLRKQSPQHPLSTPPLTKAGMEGVNSQLSTPNSYHLLWGLKHYADTYFIDEFIDLTQRHDNFSFTVCLSQEDNLDMIDSSKQPYFHLGRMTGLVDGIVGTLHATSLQTNLQSSSPTTYNLPPTAYYICGGRQVVEAIKTHLLEKGISKDQLHFEKF